MKQNSHGIIQALPRSQTMQRTGCKSIGCYDAIKPTIMLFKLQKKLIPYIKMVNGIASLQNLRDRPFCAHILVMFPRYITTEIHSIFLFCIVMI